MISFSVATVLSGSRDEIELDLAPRTGRKRYRSTQKVIDTFSDFASGMDLPAELRDLNLAANHVKGADVPEMRIFVTPDEEAAGIAANVRELEKAGVKLRDQAILCRANRRLNEIAKDLEDRGIPVLQRAWAAGIRTSGACSCIRCRGGCRRGEQAQHLAQDERGGDRADGSKSLTQPLNGPWSTATLDRTSALGDIVSASPSRFRRNCRLFR
jgi:hypothetical protein